MSARRLLRCHHAVDRCQNRLHDRHAAPRAAPHGRSSEAAPRLVGRSAAAEVGQSLCGGLERNPVRMQLHRRNLHWESRPVVEDFLFFAPVAERAETLDALAEIPPPRVYFSSSIGCSGNTSGSTGGAGGGGEGDLGGLCGGDLTGCGGAALPLALFCVTVRVVLVAGFDVAETRRLRACMTWTRTRRTTADGTYRDEEEDVVFWPHRWKLA